MALFLGVALLSGIVDLLIYHNDDWLFISLVVSTIITVGAATLWCIYDARIMRLQIPRDLILLIVFLTPAGVLLYLVKSRGWRKAMKLGFGAPVLALHQAFYYMAWYTTRWIAGSVGYYE